jgi:superfamily I DNA/RNA helicase
MSINLSEEQKLAVLSDEPRLLVVAGAGSGKTSVLIAKVSRLIKEKGVAGNSVLMLTFSRKAANELKRRLIDDVGTLAKGVMASTFHSFALRLIKKHISLTGLPENFQIADENTKARNLYTVGNELHMEKKAVTVYRDLLKQQEKEGFAMPSCYDELQKRLNDKLRGLGLIEISDIIPIAKKLLDEYPEILKIEQERYRYILIDEYQDINEQQYNFVYPFIESATQFVAVGDDDQCIYEWRGSRPELMKKSFESSDFKTIYLKNNFRSQANIITLANKIIAHNEKRIPKEMVPVLSPTLIPEYHAFTNESDEASFIADKILFLHNSTSLNYENIAILPRNSCDGDAHLIEALHNRNIPFIDYNIFGDNHNWIYSFLLEIAKDSPEKKRLINLPTQIIDNETFKEIIEKNGIVSKNRNEDLEKISKLEVNDFWFPVFKSRLEIIEKIQALKETLSPAKLINQLYDSFVTADDAIGQDETKAYEEIFELASQYEATSSEPLLSDFLDFYEETREEKTQSQKQGVQIMTIHKAKGLEFSCVFIPSVGVGNFPNDFYIKSKGDMEPERRLLYVGMTRAKEFLCLTNGNNEKCVSSLGDGFVSEIKAALRDKSAYKYGKTVFSQAQIKEQVIEPIVKVAIDEPSKKILEESNVDPMVAAVVERFTSQNRPYLTREIKDLSRNVTEMISDASRDMTFSSVSIGACRSFIYGPLKIILDNILGTKAFKVTDYLKTNGMKRLENYQKLMTTNKISPDYLESNFSSLCDFTDFLSCSHHGAEKSQWKKTRYVIESFNSKEKSQKIICLLSPIKILYCLKAKDDFFAKVENGISNTEKSGKANNAE